MDPRQELHALFGRAIELLGQLHDTPPPAPQPEPQPPPQQDEVVLVRPLKRAFDMLGVKNTKGHELINSGALVRVKLGPRASAITMASIRRVQRQGV